MIKMMTNDGAGRAGGRPRRRHRPPSISQFRVLDPTDHQPSILRAHQPARRGRVLCSRSSVARSPSTGNLQSPDPENTGESPWRSPLPVTRLLGELGGGGGGSVAAAAAATTASGAAGGGGESADGGTGGFTEGGRPWSNPRMNGTKGAKLRPIRRRSGGGWLEVASSKLHCTCSRAPAPCLPKCRAPISNMNDLLFGLT